MLKRMRRCANCGAEIESLRSTKTYCSDACRKKAARGETDLDRKVSSSWMVEHLFGMGLIGKVWPVYAWDDSPAIYVLMKTTIQNALDELNAVAPDLGWKQVTESEFTRTMNLWKIETSDSGPKLQAAIKAFYDARKDRRLEEGYTPTDKTKDDH
jgi:hypothetical protein